MVAITLNQSLLNEDISSLPSNPSALGQFEAAQDALFEAFKVLPDSQPVPAPPGTLTRTYTNPVFAGGNVKTTGTVTATMNADGTPASASYSFSGLSLTDGTGEIKVALTATASTNFNNSTYSLSYSSSGATFKSTDGTTSWALTGTETYSASNTNQNGTFSANYTSLRVQKGTNHLTYSGSLRIDTAGNRTGDITSISGNIAGVPIELTGLKINAQEFTSFSPTGTFDSFLPDLLGGNDTITLSGPINRIAEGLGGNDSITGSSAADTIDGGAGADTINAGAGNDVIYAGLRDVIDGGAGFDTVDLNTLVREDGTSYDFLDRPLGKFNVTGTPTALVFTDTFQQGRFISVRFNNIEEFTFNGQVVSAGRMLDPSSIDLTGNDLLWGNPIATKVGVEQQLMYDAPFRGAVDLDFFSQENFSKVVNYNPYTGTYNFAFSSKEVNATASTFTFTETAASSFRETSYALENIAAGIKFKGKQYDGATASNFTFSYENTQGNTDTKDNVSVAFSFGEIRTNLVGPANSVIEQFAETFSVNVLDNGTSLSVSGTATVKMQVDADNGRTRISDISNYKSYRLNHTSPDGVSSDNFTVSFSDGTISYLNSGPQLTFNVNNLAIDTFEGTLSTRSGTLKFDTQEYPDANSIIFGILQDKNALVRPTIKDFWSTILGVNEGDDGSGAADSILDFSNVVTLKKSGAISAGGNADTVTGSSEADTIDGGAGEDLLNTGAGDDLIYAGLGDVIDGGAGIDKVDFSRLLDANGKVLTYDLYKRDSAYTVSGTPTALVLTDIASKQTIKFNNVENFIIGGAEVSADKFLAPNSQTRTGNELLWGIGDTNPNISPRSPLAMGVQYAYTWVPLTEHVDLSFFQAEDFSGLNNTKIYDPDKGSFNFSFTSKAVNTAVSTFTFKEVTVPSTGSGGSRSTSYGLSNTAEGLTYTATQTLSDTLALRNGITSGTYKTDRSYAFADTQGTARLTDDLNVSFKSSDSGSWSLSDSIYTEQKDSTYAVSFAEAGLSLSSSGTTKGNVTLSGSELTGSKVLTTFTKYTLAFKDIDPSKISNNYSISFAGSIAYDLVGKSIDPNATGPLQIFTVTDYVSEDALSKLTTAKAVIDISKNIDPNNPTLAAWLNLHQSSSNKVDQALASRILSTLGFLTDGESKNDSIWDAANALTLKQGTYAYTGAQADTITGSAGNDTINAGTGADSVSAGKGDDRVFADLGDVIDGGEGIDTVDLGTLLRPDGGTYDFLTRNGDSGYTVTGTAAALVFKDTGTNQTVKFNNVEQFKLGDLTFSAGRMLIPTTIDITGNDLLWGNGTKVDPQDNLAPRALAQGTEIFLSDFDGNGLPLHGTVDLSFFDKDNFSTIQNYNPDKGTFNFNFNSTSANGTASVFKFTETTAPNPAGGGSRVITYDLSNAAAGITFKGGLNSSESYSTTNGVTTWNAKLSDWGFTYTNTQGTTDKLDDIASSFKFTIANTGSKNAPNPFFRETGTFIASYDKAGLTLGASGTFMNSETLTSGFRVEANTLTFDKYSLSYKNPDSTQTEANGSISFNGSIAYNNNGKTEPDQKIETQFFTIKNFVAEDVNGKITTTLAKIDLSSEKYLSASYSLLLHNKQGQVDESVVIYLTTLLGLEDNGDGSSAFDSILDAANTITLKRSGETYAGGDSDTVTGSDKTDTVDGGAGADILNMGAGDDLIYAGLGDVIDGGTGIDKVDFSRLLDANGKVLPYDLYKRDGMYTVSGTPTALVLTDVASKQTIKFNNVENFIIGGVEVSAATMLAPNSQARTGNELLRGIGTSDPNIAANSALALGYRYVLSPQRVPLTSEIDLSFFEGVDFSGANNTKTYDPDKGTFNFTFTNGSGSNLSTFTFAETTVPNAGSGGSRTTTYGLSNAAEGVTFTGTQGNVDTFKINNGVYSATYKIDRSFAFADTKGTAKTTADDLIIGFKANDTGSWTSKATGFAREGTGSWTTNYAQQGLTLASSGTYKESITTVSSEPTGEKLTYTVTSTYNNYKLAYTNPDTSKTGENFSIGFSGSLAYDLVGTSLDKTASGPRHIFTITNYESENAFGKLTAAKATLDLSKSIDPNDPNLSVWLKLHQTNSGTVDGALIGQVASFLGIFNDGEGSADSILDAANVLTLKQATYAYTGAQADTITGSTGNDTINAGTGADSISAGNGDDLIFADLGDVIDGGGGIDTVDLSTLVKADGSSYNFLDRINGTGYTVTGTAAALVFKDTGTNQTVKFNNVEQFKLDDLTFSAGRMLNPSTIDVTGDQLLWGIGTAIEGLSPKSPLAKGINYVLTESDNSMWPLYGETDLQYFKDAKFTTLQNYNPDAGTFNFTFKSNADVDKTSVFKFTETAVAATATGASRATSYQLDNADLGISFKGTRSFTDSYSVTNGFTTESSKRDVNFSYTNTQATKATTDDVTANFKISVTGTESDNPANKFLKNNGTFSVGYSNGKTGWSLASAGTFTDTETVVNGNPLNTQVTNLTSYTLTYKNPDSTNTADNLTVSFTGAVDAVYDGSAKIQTFTIKNFKGDFDGGTITTVFAKLDISSDKYLKDDVVFRLFQGEDGKVDDSVGTYLSTLLGLEENGDGPLANDSILDYANTVTFKRAGEAYLGAGADTLTGSGGDDKVDGGTGADTLNMGAGNDLIYAGLGDVIDGEGGNDTADLSRLLDANGQPLPYSLYDRVNKYTVSGTPTALVLTDIASNQTIKFKNIENFVLKEGTFSAQQLLSPYTVSGDDLLWGIGAANPNLDKFSYLVMGLERIFHEADTADPVYPFYGDIDLDFFRGEAFTQTVPYNPDGGAHNFSFTSKAINTATSTFTFKETTVPDLGTGGSRSTSFGLSNTQAGINLTGATSGSRTITAIRDGKSVANKGEITYTYSDTQGNVSTADDITLSFKIGGSSTETYNASGYSELTNGNFNVNYANSGWSIVSNGTFTDSEIRDTDRTVTTDKSLVTITSYVLSYKNPVVGGTVKDNFRISFGGSIAEDYIGTGTASSPNPTQILTLTNLSMDFVEASITTARAVIDLSERFDKNLILNSFSNSNGRVDESIGDYLSSLFGLDNFADGEDPNDSILDAANVVTMKVAGEGNLGAGNDTVIGSDFNDKINGNTGADSITAGKGDDLIYAGLGDFIDGGEGFDTVDLGTLSRPGGGTYDFFTRNDQSGYTVTGTTSALVFKDTATSQTVKFNNVEQFKLGSETFSAGRMLTPSSVDLSGSDILLGKLSIPGNPNMKFMGRSTAMGVENLLDDNFFATGDVDLDLFLQADFAQIVNYNPASGNHTFNFIGSPVDGASSNFKFTETSTAYSDRGGARNTTYELKNVPAGVEFKANVTYNDTFGAPSAGSTPFSFTGSKSFSFIDTLGTSATSDDVRINSTWTESGNGTQFSDFGGRFQDSGTFTLNYANAGSALVTNGSWSGSGTYGSDGQPTARIDTVTLASYTLSFTDPDKANTASNFSLSFSGALNYDLVGKSLDQNATGPRQFFTVNNLSFEDSVGRLTTTKAVLDLSAGIVHNSDQNFAVLLGFLENDSGSVDNDVLDNVLALFNVDGDSPSPRDSIWDAANGYTIKIAGAVATGDGNDTITGSSGTDSIDAGSGLDLVNAGAGDDFIRGGDGADVLNGDAGNDAIDGGIGADTISGGAGNDSLMGGLGNDNIVGGDGDDGILAGAGDVITGGNGNDIWVIDDEEIKDITDVSGSWAAISITGIRKDDSNFSITVNTVEAVVIGSSTYDLTSTSFNSLKEILLTLQP